VELLIIRSNMLANYVRKWIEINGVPQQVKDIVDYCIRKENGQVFIDMDESTITTMVTYHLFKKTLSVIYKGNEIVGVHMWYNCDYTDDFSFILNWEEDKKDGDTIFIAFLFAEDDDAMIELLHDFIDKEPDMLVKKLKAIRGNQEIDVSRKWFTKVLKRRNYGKQNNN
jgi:hypothetical protein